MTITITIRLVCVSTGLHVPEVLPAGVSAFDTADARGMRGFSCAVGSRVLALPIFRHLGAIGTDGRASKQQEEQQRWAMGDDCLGGAAVYALPELADGG